MGVPLKSEQIRHVLANANETAKSEGDRLLEAEAEPLKFLRDSVRFLRDPAVPKTYLAVTAILLAARAMHDRETLDVLAIQAGEGERGYSASSIGSTLASFAKEHRIDLRAKSSQPMNNQPFTFKSRITSDMKVNVAHQAAWGGFFKVTEHIDRMTSGEAKEGLALLFHMSRRRDAAAVTVTVRASGRAALDEVTTAVADFVTAHSDNGKVGQAFAAALLDVTYGIDQVILGDTQDPDASTPGDVQVSTPEGVWLWTEAKQKVIQTGDITGFLEKVRQVGGERVVYFALTNSGYSGYIKPDTIQKEAKRLGVDVTVLESPRAAIDLYASVAPGSFAFVAGALLERLRARMVQSDCSHDVLIAFDSMASDHARLA